MSSEIAQDLVRALTTHGFRELGETTLCRAFEVVSLVGSRFACLTRER